MNETKAGFIAVVGRPNAGKSTLLNHLVGERVAMVSKKAQATRKRMNMIVMHEESQLIFVDTPGIHHKEKLINQFMLEEALKAMGDSDLIIFLAPASDNTKEYEKFLELTESKNSKHIIILTKIDQVPQAKLLEALHSYQPFSDRFEAIIPFSVNKSVGKKDLLNIVSKHLPFSPWLFDTDILTTEHIRSIYKELIRESIFENMSDEIPYESDVIIDKIDEEELIDRVQATIVVEKEVQKRMIVGKGGEAIKRIGIGARKIMEQFAQKKIHLELIVAVKPGWSKNKIELERFGYIF